MSWAELKVIKMSRLHTEDEMRGKKPEPPEGIGKRILGGKEGWVQIREEGVIWVVVMFMSCWEKQEGKRF